MAKAMVIAKDKLMGAGAEVDTDGDGIPNVEYPELGDGTVAEVDQTVKAAWDANFKAMYDSWQSDSQQQARQRQNLQDKLNDQHLRFVEDQHTLLMRTADTNALLATQIANQSALAAQRMAGNASTLDLLIASGEVDTTAQGIAGLKLSEEFRSIAKQAVEAAVAAVPGTSAASQGTTGVAQGSLQTQMPIELAGILNNNITIQTAILKALADVNTSLGILLVKVTGEEVTAEKPV